MFPDKPIDYILSPVYVPFKLNLANEFVTVGDVQIRQVDTWFTDFNMLGVRLRFSNGESEFTTKIFGTDSSSNGKPIATKTVNLKEPVTKISHLMINT
jgi:hypothetical protein